MKYDLVIALPPQHKNSYISERPPVLPRACTISLLSYTRIDLATTIELLKWADERNYATTLIPIF